MTLAACYWICTVVAPEIGRDPWGRAAPSGQRPGHSLALCAGGSSPGDKIERFRHLCRLPTPEGVRGDTLGFVGRPRYSSAVWHLRGPAIKVCATKCKVATSCGSLDVVSVVCSSAARTVSM